jgi:hypothetical protein
MTGHIWEGKYITSREQQKCSKVARRIKMIEEQYIFLFFINISEK